MHMYNPTYVFQTHRTTLHLTTLLTIDYRIERVYIDLSGPETKISFSSLKPLMEGDVTSYLLLQKLHVK